MKLHLRSSIVLLICYSYVHQCLADPILPPLPPGTQYRVAFVTSGTTNATSIDIATYNAFVTSAANSQPLLVGLDTTWTAIAATASAPDARTNTATTGTGVSIYLLDGSTDRLADNYDDLWDGSLDRALNVTEAGGFPFSTAWTGADSDGFGTSGFPLGSSNPLVGSSGAVDSSWLNSSQSDRTFQNPMYAISDTLTAVPEPSASILLGVVGLGFLAVMQVKKQKKKPNH